MSGITSGVGVFSGINTGQIIEQLLAIEARPRDQAQTRVLQLQLKQGSYLDINSRLSAVRSAAKAFRESKTFQTKSGKSSNEDALTLTTSSTAPVGTYKFIVDRLVTTQQQLSRGFTNKDSAAVGATEFTFEGAQARLDRDINLSDLNNGQGVSRGKIVITDRAGGSATVDLSRTTTVQEVIDAINSNGTARVSASVQGGKFVLSDASGSTSRNLTVTSAAGYDTAASLGIAGDVASSTLTGSTVYALNGNTTLQQLNDGNGVFLRNTIGTDVHNFRVLVTDAGNSTTTVKVNLGDVYQEQTVDGVTKLVKTEGAVTTVKGAVDRINAALTAAGQTTVSAQIDSTNGRLSLVDASGVNTVTVQENGDSTAADLGLLVPPTATSILGKRVFAGLNTSLARGLNGGQGVSGDGVLNFTLRDGSSFSAVIDTTASLTDIFRSIEAASDFAGSKRVSVSLDSRGTGLVLKDLTGGGGTFAVAGTSGADTAASLGISRSVSADTISSGNLQRRYVSLATRLADLNNGQGVGTGSFRLTDSDGASSLVTIGDNIQTVGDLINNINSRGLRVTARVNSNGDGIEIIENTASQAAGAVKLKIADESGSVAKSLNLAGQATGTGTDNKLNGTYERKVTFSASDTLQQVTDKLNAANVGVSAAIVQDGAGSTPYRLSLTSTSSGTRGRYLLDTGSLDLGLQTLETGSDSRVFFGSSDAARAIAITGSTNSVDGVLQGVKIDLRAVEADPVTITISRDTDAMVTGVNVFVKAFNTAIDRIDTQTRYDVEAKKGAPLVGDSTAIELRSALFSMINNAGQNTTGRYKRLTEIGLKVGTGGDLQLDEDVFRQALQQDPASVESLFAARTLADDKSITLSEGVTVRNPNAGTTFTSLGVMGQFEELVTRYIDSTNGLLTGQSKALTDQIAVQNARIDSFNARLGDRRTILQRQFASMETAIQKMQSQQSALSSIR